MAKIKDFTDLLAWQKGHRLVILIYKSTSSFPKSETYSLVDKMRRAVVSITSNLAEGFSRQTRKEKIQFYYIAAGSVAELRNQLIIARDLEYLGNEEFRNLNSHTIEVGKMIQGLIRSLKRR